jgi:hypothetical protein
MIQLLLGKVDRRALSLPESKTMISRATSSTDLPVTSMIRHLCSMLNWRA